MKTSKTTVALVSASHISCLKRFALRQADHEHQGERERHRAGGEPATHGQPERNPPCERSLFHDEQRTQ